MGENIVVIDTETTYSNLLMSVGIVIADSKTYLPVCSKYYLVEPNMNYGGIYSNALFLTKEKNIMKGNYDDVIDDIQSILNEFKVKSIFAYNATFDHRLLPELERFNWYDILKIAAYKQYNRMLPPYLEYCSTGRLKANYGVQPILRYLSCDNCYCETHNAVNDAYDELLIMKLLGHDISVYEIAKLL